MNKTRAEHLPIEKLHPFEGHPFKVADNEEMEQLMESILAQGVLTPLVVRSLENGEYEVISGHRRLHACKRAGIESVPALITEMDRDAAAIALVDSNLHREHILPSEKAFAYKLKMDALKHQGQTCGQVGHKSRDTLSEEESGRQVQRYIRLTNLIPGILQIGTIGLIKGITTFDASKGARLATYAARCVENEILMYFRSQRKTGQDVSLSDYIDTGTDGAALSLMDVVSEDDDLLEKVSTREQIAHLRSAIAQCLTEQERLVISMRYGLDGNSPHRQREVAQKTGISRSYVSRIEKRALQKIRCAMESE